MPKHDFALFSSVPLDVTGLARLCHVSEKTIYSWKKRGLLPRPDLDAKRFKWRMGTIENWLNSGAGLAKWLVERHIPDATHKSRWRQEVEEARNFKRKPDAPQVMPGAPVVVVRHREA